MTETFKIEIPEEDKMDIIFDMDGTLSNPEHRRHFVTVKPYNWKKFKELASDDKPIEPIAVLSRDPTDGDYLTALVHADATFEQIDAFCKEYLTGSWLPFIWTPLKDVHKLIIASQNEDIYYPSREVRTGPSKYVLELEARVMAREIIEQCAAARETRDARTTEQL